MIDVFVDGNKYTLDKTKEQLAILQREYPNIKAHLVDSHGTEIICAVSRIELESTDEQC